MKTLFLATVLQASAPLFAVTGVSGSGATRDVTVNVTGGSGEFRLRVID